MDGRNRKDIRPGLAVEVVLKQDQRTGKRTRGVVRDILTPSSTHPHGIKVRLTDGGSRRSATTHSEESLKPPERKPEIAERTPETPEAKPAPPKSEPEAPGELSQRAGIPVETPETGLGALEQLPESPGFPVETRQPRLETQRRVSETLLSPLERLKGYSQRPIVKLQRPNEPFERLFAKFERLK